MTAPIQVSFLAEDKAELQAYETAILLHFTNFKIDQSLLKSHHSKIFLVVDFFVHKSTLSKVVKANEGTFDTQMMFIAKNCSVFRDYLLTKEIPFYLNELSGVQFTQIASGNLDLSHFADYDDSITTTASLFSNGSEVGTIDFEAQILVPVVR